jgi:hypothetical protein
LSAVITPTRGNTQPRCIIILDCELQSTQSSAPGHARRDSVSMIRSIHWDNTRLPGTPLTGVQTDEVPRWWDWLEDMMPRKTVTYIVGIGMYRMMTALGFWARCETGEWAITAADPAPTIGSEPPERKPWHGYCVTADPPTIVLARCGRTGLTAKWLDARNWGLRTTDLPTDPHERTQALTRWVLYTVRWLDAHGLGGLQDTSGAQAMYSWRRRFLTHRVARHDDAAVHELERRAYYGGRCECGYVGDVRPAAEALLQGDYHVPYPTVDAEVGPVYHLDANSLYPSVCMDTDVPVELVQVDEHPGHNPLDGQPSDLIRIADVEIETDVPAYPWRHETGTYWPVGRYWTTLAEPELRLAEQSGHVRQYGMTAYYLGAPALSDYMHWMYDQRLQFRQRGDSASAALLKAMLVGLPGKLAQQSRRWVDDTRARPPWSYGVWYQRDPDTRKIRKWRSVAWHVQVEQEVGHHPESVPSIAAWITSAARVRLWRYISACPSNSVIYWDTDSVWCLEPAYRALLSAGQVHESAPGLLSMRSCHQRVSICGIKHYTADGIETHAGVPVGVKVDADGQYRFAVPRSFAAQLAGRKPPEPLVDERVIRARQQYRHGVIGGDGWVSPFVLRSAAQEEESRE